MDEVEAAAHSVGLVFGLEIIGARKVTEINSHQTPPESKDAETA